MALLTTHTIVNAGTAPTFVAAAASDTITRIITVIVPGNTEYDDGITDHALTIAATTGELWIPIRAIARDPATGLVTITTSAQTNVTVAAVRLV